VALVAFLAGPQPIEDDGMIINYNEHYGDPNIGMGCMPDERPLQV